MVDRIAQDYSTRTAAATLSWPAPESGFVLEPGLGPEGTLPLRFRSPGAKVVHVWGASLDVSPFTLARCREPLSNRELDRADRFRFDLHRDRYIVAHGWLRELLGGYLSIPATAVEFDYGPKGKPALGRSLRYSGLQFSLAHSEGLSLIAIAHETCVGIDVERIRVLPDFEDLVARFFSKRENAEFKSLPDAVKPEAFFNLWTRKEAWLKATGQGIAHLLGRVEVSFVPGNSARLLKLPEPSKAASSWSLWDLAPGPGFAAALAAAASDVQVECRRWSPERLGLVL